MPHHIVHLINTGFFHADGGSMFGATPRSAWSRRYPCDENNRCILAMRVGIVKTKCGRIILIDTGVGNKQLEMLKSTSYQFFNLVSLSEALLSKGIHPEQVTDIILSHLHFDHCGDVTTFRDGIIIPTFPKATCWCSKAQWINTLHPIPLEADSFFFENTDIIHKKGNLQLIENDFNLCEGIQLCLYDGHTKGQIVTSVTSDEYTYIFAGDVIPVSPQVSPLWISAYDLFPATSYFEKIRLLEVAASNNHAIVYYHDAYLPCSTIKKINNFFKIDHKIAL